MKKFKTHYYKIPLDPKRFHLSGRVRLVMLSDLHGNSYGENNAELLRRIEDLKPDLVLTAGDMITADSAPVPKAVPALLSGLACRFPVFYANGNHEIFMKMDKEQGAKACLLEYQRELRESGVLILENQAAEINVKGLPAVIYGLESEKGYKRFCYQKMKKEEVRKLLGEPDKQAFGILLAHNPMDFPAYAGWGADLVLAGHLHGGFLRLPGLGGVISPQMHLFPKYDKGLYQLRSSRMIVGAGIGDHFPPPRLFNPRELVVADLY